MRFCYHARHNHARHNHARLGLAWGLVAMLVVIGVTGAANAAEKGRIGVELNKLEAVGESCRAYLVLANGTGSVFKSLKLDLVMFDPDGIVQRRVAVEAAPLTAGKTTLKVFDIAKMSCASVGKVLLNSVMSCETAAGPMDDCLANVSVSSRTKQPLIK